MDFELWPLDAIQDSYPKLVLSTDRDINADYDGVQHVNNVLYAFALLKQLVAKVVPKSIAKSMSQVRKNQLLLFFAQMNNVTEAKNAFSWIVSDVTIINKNVDINAKPFIPFFRDETNKEKMLIFLRAADFNIYDIELRERLQPQQKVTINQDVNGEISTSIQTVDEKVTDIYLAHKNREGKLFWLHYKDESAGTKFDFDSPDCRRQDYGYKKRYLQGVYGADQIINYPMLEDVLGVNFQQKC